MSQTVVIARREIVDKRFVLITAVAIAVVPFLLPLLPGRHVPAAELMLVTAAILSVGFSAALAAVLGASFIGRDVSEGRMSFFFARPVSAASIYLGKLSAALLLIVASFLIIFGPMLAAHPATWPSAWSVDARAALGTFAAGTLALFAVAHALSTFVRSRSPLVAVDFALAVVTGFVVWWLFRPLIEAGAGLLVVRLVATLVVVGAVAILAGGAWQVANARIDRVRNHVELSRFMWPAFAVILLIAAGWVTWVTHASPNDLNDFFADQSPDGSHAVVIGPVQHRGDYQAAFLLDTRSGTFQRLRAGWRVDGEFTRDGSKLVLLRGGATRGTAEVFVGDVATGAEQETGLTVPSGNVVLNDAGSRLAVVSGGSVAVFDIPSKRSLASAHIADDGNLIHGAFFAGNDAVRVYSEPPRIRTGAVRLRTLRIQEIDLNTRALRDTGSITVTSSFAFPVTDVSGSRLRMRDGNDLLIADARTGARLASIAPSAGGRLGSATFLTGGGIAVGEIVDGNARLRVVNDDGSPRGAIGLGPDARMTFPVREVAKGRVIAGVLRRNGDWGAFVLDVDRGSVVDQRPMRMLVGNEWGRSTLDTRVGPVGPSLLFRDGAKLVRWNVVTGERKELLTARAPGV